MVRKPIIRIDIAIGATESMFLEILDSPALVAEIVYLGGPILAFEGQPIVQDANENENANQNEPQPEQ